MTLNKNRTRALLITAAAFAASSFQIANAANCGAGYVKYVEMRDHPSLAQPQLYVVHDESLDGTGNGTVTIEGPAETATATFRERALAQMNLHLSQYQAALLSGIPVKITSDSGSCSSLGVTFLRTRMCTEESDCS